MPIAINAIGSEIAAASAAAVAASTAGLATAQETATASTLGLANAAKLENTEFGRQAVILPAATAATLEVAGAQRTLAASSAGAISNSEKLNAALLGLRTIAGSSAVIGLGALSLAAIAAGNAIRSAVQGAASLEQELNVFRITARATADDMERVSSTAVELGKDVRLPAVTATDAVQAFTELAKAGLDVEDSLEGGRAVLELSAAAQIDFAQSAELTANALNAFGLSGASAVHVADLLANASNAAQGSILDMGLALQQSAAVANQLGLSVETTVAFITQLARAGIQGSDAGTSLRVALTRLIAPTEKAQEQLEKFKVELRDVNGNLRTDVFVQLGQAMEGLGRQERARALFEIFGQDAQRAAAILSNSTLPVLQETVDSLNETGAAAELAGARSVGFSGQMEALKSSLQTLGTTLGGLALGPLGSAADGLRTLANDAVFATEKLKELNENLPGVGGDRGGFLGGAFRALTRGFGDTQKEIAATVDLLRRGETIEFGKSATQTLTGLNRQAEISQESIKSLRTDVTSLFKQFQAGGGRGSATALNEFVLGLQELARAQEEGLVTNDQLAASIRLLIDDLQTGDFSVDVGVKLDEIGLRRDAKDGANIVLDTLKDNLSPDAAAAIGLSFMGGLGEGIEEGGEGVKAIVQSFTSNLQTQFAQLEAAGATPGALLENLNQQLERAIERQQQIEQKAAAGRLARPNERIREAADQVTDIRNRIQSILDSQKRDAEAAAEEVERARDDRDQAILDLLSGKRERRERFISQAGGTESLRDDIRLRNRFIDLLEQQILRVRQTISDAKQRAATIAQLNAQIVQVVNQVKVLRQQQREALAEAAEARRDRLEQSIQLDIDLASTTGNVQGEIRARQRLINFLKKQIREVKKGTNAWKELRNAIAAEQAAIKELRGQTEEGKSPQQSFRELTFDFLQKQQGFAANLMGNLIPGGATGGLVGNVSPEGQVETAAALNEAKRETPFRATQGERTNALLTQILQAIKSGNGRVSHPEARYQAATMGGAMDTM